jgi:hypothetical protein
MKIDHQSTRQLASPEELFGPDIVQLLQPTPVALDDRIRIFCGLRGADGVSRVGYFDVDRLYPENIIGISNGFVLEVGKPGMFDENGVVPCCAIRVDGDESTIRLLYAGYQRGQQVPFSVFGGHAVSHDHGKTFVRSSQVPVTDRIEGETLFRVIHSVIRDGAGYRVWYGAGDSFITINGRLRPTYDIRSMKCDKDFHNWSTGQPVLTNVPGETYRVARPFVVKIGRELLMLYYKASYDEIFSIALATSTDGLVWTDVELDFSLGAGTEWCRNMAAYPSVIVDEDRLLVFFNGDDYGSTGVILSVLGLDL